MSLLPRSLWKIFQLMVSNAKEPSRKLAGVSSLLSVHLLHWKCFRSEYLKQDIIWFYLHFSDYDWSGYFFSVYFLLAFPSLWMFYSYIKGPLKKKKAGLVDCSFAIFSNKLGSTQLGLSPGPHQAFRYSQKQYLVSWWMKDLEDEQLEL